MRVKIKICGITSLEDALLCQDADALGFIFAEASPRCVSLPQVKNIISALPPFCERVGVFVDEELESIVEISSQCGLSAIQLHGQESNQYVQQLAKLSSLPLIRAFREPSRKVLQELDTTHLQAVLIDGIDKVSFRESREILSIPLIRAGGLNVQNLPSIMSLDKPQYIDLCSSLEGRVPGHKDPEKTKEFFSLMSGIH